MSSDSNKPGSSLDDLKARLGLDTVLSKPKPKQTEDKPPVPAAKPVGALRSDSTPAPPGPEVAPLADLSPSTDYASAVQNFEDPVAGEGEPDPVISGPVGAIDPSMRTPMAQSARNAMIGATVVGVLLALAVGFGFGKVMRDRGVANAIIDEAADLLGKVEPLASALNDFQAALAAVPDDYSEATHSTIFVNFTQPATSVLSAKTVSDSRVLMTTGDELAELVLDYSLQTQALAGLVETHIGRTARDHRNIETLLAGEAEGEENFAIYFDNLDLGSSYNAFETSPDENPYTPPMARVVTYETLEMVVQEGEERNDYYYSVQLPTGQTGQVEIFNLLRLGREQLVENSNEETALHRYSARMAEIREQTSTVLRLQGALIQELETRAAESHRFAL